MLDSTLPPPTGSAGALFGLVVASNGEGVDFVDDDTNTLNLLYQGSGCGVAETNRENGMEKDHGSDRHAQYRAPRTPRPTRQGPPAVWLPGWPAPRWKMSPTVREHAKHLVFDGVACAQFGAQLPVPIRAWKGSRP